MEKRGEKLRPPPLCDAPWLLYTLNRIDGISSFQYFRTISSNNNKNHNDKRPKYIKSIPELRGKVTLGFSHGWILLRDVSDRKSFSVWNPVTLQPVDLPPVDNPEWSDAGAITSCILTSSPDCSREEYKCVILVFRERFFFSCRLKGDRDFSNQWSVQRLEAEGVVFNNVFQTVSCEGKTYGLAYSGDRDDPMRFSMIVVDFADDDTGRLSLKSLRLSMPSYAPAYLMSRFYLVESCGIIYLVNVLTRHLGIEFTIDAIKVRELNMEKMNWDEVNSLGDRAFFLEHSSGCTWCWARTTADSEHGPESGSDDGVEGNCIYIVGDDYPVQLYCYKLKDRTLSFLSCCRRNLEVVNPTWVFPYRQRLFGSELQISSITEEQKIDKEDSFLASSSSISDYQEHLHPLLQLPTEIIFAVSSGLHVFDYFSFRAACKSLRLACPPQAPPLWRTNNCYPMYLFSKTNDATCIVMDLCRNVPHSIVLPKLSEAQIDFSKDGWLLFRNICIEEGMEYFNPFTRVRGSYPQSYKFFQSVGFSTSPSSSDCLTVGLIDDDMPYICIGYIQFGEESWKFAQFERVEDEFHLGTSSPVYYDGAFYFLDKRGCLGEFRLVEGQASWKLHGRPETYDTLFLSYYLVECDGELLSVLIGMMGSWVEVFRFYLSRGKWTTVKDLKNHCLFVGTPSSFSVVALQNEMSNRIYLPRFYGNGIIFYSLDTGKYHVVGSEDSLEDLQYTTQHFRCSWL